MGSGDRCSTGPLKENPIFLSLHTTSNCLLLICIAQLLRIPCVGEKSEQKRLNNKVHLSLLAPTKSEFLRVELRLKLPWRELG